MAIDRRTLLAGLAAAPLAATLARTVHGREREALFVGCRVDEAGNATGAIVNSSGGEFASIALPARGHDAAIRPGGRECVIFARRPGRFAVALATDGRDPVWFEAAPGRLFYGHGVFSPDGRLLYSPENDYEAARGVIGVRDATGGYARIGELPSHDIGPHDAALLSDGRTLVIANGGIETHPDYPRMKLNLATMAPSLAYVDIETGDLLEHHRLAGDLHQLSIRHLAVAHDETVVFGGQYEGPQSDLPPLIGFHRRGSEPVMVGGSAETHRAMNNYVGSVAIDQAGEIAACSAPRGGLVTYWDIASRRLVATTRMADVCGVAAHEHGFVVTSGEAAISEVADPAHPGNATVRATPGQHWDNHLRPIG